MTIAPGTKFAPSENTIKNAHVDGAKYTALYEASVSDPEAFWGEQAQRIDWIKPFTQVK
ncbi:hypothetical protein GG681_16510, partial [Epibacterium sp. SM1969]